MPESLEIVAVAQDDPTEIHAREAPRASGVRRAVPSRVGDDAARQSAAQELPGARAVIRRAALVALLRIGRGGDGAGRIANAGLAATDRRPDRAARHRDADVRARERSRILGRVRRRHSDAAIQGDAARHLPVAARRRRSERRRERRLPSRDHARLFRGAGGLHERRLDSKRPDQRLRVPRVRAGHAQLRSRLTRRVALESRMERPGVAREAGARRALRASRERPRRAGHEQRPVYLPRLQRLARPLSTKPGGAGRRHSIGVGRRSARLGQRGDRDASPSPRSRSRTSPRPLSGSRSRIRSSGSSRSTATSPFRRSAGRRCTYTHTSSPRPAATLRSSGGRTSAGPARCRRSTCCPSAATSSCTSTRTTRSRSGAGPSAASALRCSSFAKPSAAPRSRSSRGSSS